MVFNFSSSTTSSSSSLSTASSNSNVSTSTQLEITFEDQRNYKDTLHRMKRQKLQSYAMYMITKETIYRITMETAKEAIKILRKVISKGVCQYKPRSKTDKLIMTYKKIHEEYERMVLKMEIKLVPTKANFVIECWLKKDAALQAAQDYKAKRKEAKAAKVAAKAALAVPIIPRAKGHLKMPTALPALPPIQEDNFEHQFMQSIVLPPLSPITSTSNIPKGEPQYVNVRRHPAMGVRMACKVKLDRQLLNC